MNLSLVISLFSFTITITYGAPTLAGSRHNTITKESVSQEVATHGEGNDFPQRIIPQAFVMRISQITQNFIDKIKKQKCFYYRTVRRSYAYPH